MGKIWKDGRNQGEVTPKPGTVDAVYCGICGAKMNVRRNFRHGQFFRNNPCDLFTCPHLDCKWHKQAVLLKRMTADTPSASIAKLLKKELKAVLAKKKPTKEHFKDF